MLKKLKDQCYIVMGQSPSSEYYNQCNNGIPFLQGRKTFGDKYPKIDTWTTKPLKIGIKNSVLMSVRAPVGDVNIAPFDICIGRGLASIKMKNNNNQYLYYLLKNNIENIKRKSSGTVFEAISRSDLENLVLNFNSEEEQLKIEKILDNIDKKIELNNKLNNNLYDFAMNYLNSLTEDDAVQLSEFGKIQGGYAFKSKDLKDEKTANRIIKIKNLKSEINVDIDNSQFVDDEVILKIDKKFKLQKGDVTIAMTGAELGKTGFIYGKDNYYLNQRVGVVKGKDIKSELYLKILMLSNNFQLLLNSKGYGSAQPNISTSDIETVMIKNINKENLDAFYKTVYPIYNKIINNSEENKNLEQLRDTLLPKLMNGEIDLDNIEI